MKYIVVEFCTEDMNENDIGCFNSYADAVEKINTEKARIRSNDSKMVDNGNFELTDSTNPLFYYKWHIKTI